MKTIPSPLEARILVYDPRNKISPQLSQLLCERFPQRGGDAVEITCVNRKDELSAMVKTHGAPYYSLVVYESSIAREQGIVRVVETVSGYDRFLPQMVFGEDLKLGQIGKYARAGARYFARNQEDAEDQIDKIFKPAQEIPGLTVVKIGGSAFDFDRLIPGEKNLEDVCKILVKLREEGNPLLVTAGAGQFGDAIKDHRQKHGTNPRVQEQYPKLIVKALQANLELIKSLFPSGTSMLLDTSAFYYINDGSVRRKIPLIGTAPYYVMARDGIPLQDSDTHTIALAEFYGAKRVVLIKRTDGIYDFDPYRGYVYSKHFPGDDKCCANIGAWYRLQRRNKRHERVTVQEMLTSGAMVREGTGLDGRGDGTSGHLMEDSALQYMLDRCKRVQEIAVVHIAPEELYEWSKWREGPDESDEYQHIITRDTLTMPAGKNWTSVLEDNLRAALRGEAKSRIVRE